MIIIVFTLRVTQSVATTYEEISYTRQKEMFKSALSEYDDERRPMLTMDFKDEEPPFTFLSEQEKTIRFVLELVKGDIGRKPEVMFFAPEGFSYPGTDSFYQGDDVTIVGGLLTARLKYEDMRKGISQPGRIKIKAPSKSGKYRLFYQITCEQFEGENNKFTVNVKEKTAQ